ncbi:MAG: APC family permease [Fimbriimonadaceae bacterium]
MAEYRSSSYKQGSLSLKDAVAMGTGVMIGAGVFALTGQIAELAGPLFLHVFIVAAVVVGFSAYSYVRLASAFPSAGGIGMFLEKAYGKSIPTAVFALMMALSMVINESLVARTFGTYALQPFNVGDAERWLVPALAAFILIVTFLINISGNNVIGKFSVATAIIKVGGVTLFAVAALWVADNVVEPATATQPGDQGWLGALSALALGVLSYKGFTTITNSGSEITEPKKNIGRAIVISLIICAIVYFLVAMGVGANLDVPRIIEAKNFALAEATRPALGQYGLWFTVVIALLATSAGLLASTFAVSRMLAMITEMKLIPHRHFGMPGSIQRHTLVYVVVLALLLAVFFDLTRIASLGAILYLIMDIAIHWGVLRHLLKETKAKAWILVMAIVLDVVVLGAFIAIKAKLDPMILWVSAAAIAVLIAIEILFFRLTPQSERESSS